MNKQKIVVCVLVFALLAVAVAMVVSKEKTIKGTSKVAFENISALDLQEGTDEEIDVMSGVDEADVEDTEASGTYISNWDLNKVDVVYDTEGVAVPVPKGYVASGADGEHTVNTGFVIYEGNGAVTNENAWDESCSRNQFVWVPVPDVSRIYEVDENGKKQGKLYTYTETGRSEYEGNDYEPGIVVGNDIEQYFARYQMQGMSQDKLLYEMENNFDATIKSIENYGGFYIGRYETGILNSKETVVQRFQSSYWFYKMWCNWYRIVPNMAANANVKTSMIFGCLWDETLQWLIDSGNKTYADMVDSTSWGNYKNATFEFMTSSNQVLTKKAGTTGIGVETGSTEYTKANNIYDMAGDSSEWTLEVADGKYRIFRGGDCYSGSATLRAGQDPYYGVFGTRVYLYIN